MESFSAFLVRSGLSNAQAALRRGRITIGFIGGSITDPRPRYSWPEAVVAWLADQFPTLRIRVENAAIGGTNSELACFRARRDLVDRGCDLVFVEYAVNDLPEPSARRARSREGLLRQLLAPRTTDVVLVHVFAQAMLEAMGQGSHHSSVAEFETLAEHYQLNSVFSGLHAYRQLCRGLLRAEEWLPDGLHPQARGSLSYAEPVISLLDDLLRRPADVVEFSAKAFPAPLDPDCWQYIALADAAAFALVGAWVERRWAHHTAIDLALETHSPEASLSAEVFGHTVALGWDEGLDAGRFSWRLDGGEWQYYDRKPGAWLPETSLYRSLVLGEGLSDSLHRVELRNGLWAREGRLTGRLSLAFLAGISRHPPAQFSA
jgi:hypothetical protein